MVIAGAMACALAVPVVMAQTSDGGGAKGGRHGHFGHRGGRGEFGMMGFRQLDLTDAQKAQLKQIHENHRQATASLREQIRAKRQEIHAANQGGTVNEALAAQKLAEIAPLEAKLMADRAQIRQESLAVLTVEQKAKLDQMREQAKTRWAERRANKQQKNQ
ncbi:MAG TPA: Spy/CpxP family protein refolding chaperone [Blastocatellia bacterium]|nr:Spy/CpxP family protein refolding chaperone [Blastocatellia bacterium]